MHVLVTGFGPFGDFEENPAEAYARSLEQQKSKDFKLTVKILQVNRQQILEFIEYLSQNSFDAIYMFGVSAKEKDIRIEVLAQRVLAQDGQELDESMDFPDGDNILLSTAFLAHPLMSSHQHRLSFDAGAYFCNELYYRTLLHISSLTTTSTAAFPPAIFLHVPPAETLPVESGIIVVLDVIRKIGQIHRKLY